jgi:hypothetical protein
MFAGHIGAALAIGRAQQRVNVGVFVLAALWLDVVLWVFVLLGWESVAIPADFATTRQVRFEFPYSHGLAASLGWSCAAAWAARTALRVDWRSAAFVGVAVFSHWVLDAIVHVPELPLLGSASPRIGLGLWQAPLLGLGLEGLIVLAALAVFVPRAPLTRAKKAGLATLCLLVLAFTIAGMMFAPPPPSATAMAASSLATLVVLSLLVLWLGRLRA